MGSGVGSTHRHRVHGLNVAPEPLGGLDEQALNGCLLRAQIVHLQGEGGQGCSHLVSASYET